MLLRKLALSASAALLCTAASAAPITYNGTLSDGIPAAGSISDTSSASNPLGAQYYRFFANAGDSVTVSGARLETNYDMSFWLFSGLFEDTAAFGASFDSSDPGFIDFADDEIAHPGPFGDPFSSFVAGTTGFYTVAVTNFMSGASDDGSYDFTLTATGVQSVPEPASLLLAGLGLVGLAGLRRRG